MFPRILIARGSPGFKSRAIHTVKKVHEFPSPAGMSLTKLPLGRNNSVMTSLFPPRESLVVTSRLGTGNSRTFFLRCSNSKQFKCWYFNFKKKEDIKNDNCLLFCLKFILWYRLPFLVLSLTCLPYVISWWAFTLLPVNSSHVRACLVSCACFAPCGPDKVLY